MEPNSPLNIRQKILLGLSLTIILFILGLTNTIIFTFGERYTIGKVFKLSPTSGESVWVLNYYVNREKYDVTLSIDICNRDKVKIGDKFIVKFSRYFPSISEVDEDFKLSDTFNIAPKFGWPTMNHFAKSNFETD